MLEPIPFWGMIEVDLPVKTYAGNKFNYIKESMGANELADKCGLMIEDYGFAIEVRSMLRQQALEIKALHQILGYEGIEVGKDYLDECVADLRKAQEI